MLTLSRLKDWQRNAIGVERLSGSALWNIHGEIDITIEEVINKFAEKCIDIFICDFFYISKNFIINIMS